MIKLKAILNENLLNKAIILLCLLQVAILRYFYLTNYVGLFLDALLVVHFVLYRNKYNKLLVILFLLVPIYFFINYFICGGSLHNTIGNLRDIFYTILLFPYINYLYVNKKDDLKSLTKKLLIPVNVYFILNVIFVQLQLNGYTNLSGFTNQANFEYTFFEDSCSGLLGLYGTPLLALFYVFTFLVNIKNLELKNIKHIKLFVLYNAVICIYTLFISKLTDNKLYYVLFIAVIAVYAFFKLVDSENFKCNKIKFLLLYSVGLLLLIVLIINIPYIHPIINSTYSALIKAVDYKHNFSSGSPERLSIICYFLNELNLFFGYGVGQGRWTESGLLGYKHFGINDLSSTLCLGGVILLALYLTSFMRLFKTLYKSNIKVLVMILFTLLVMFLTQIMISLSGIILFLGICLLLIDEKTS